MTMIRIRISIGRASWVYEWDTCEQCYRPTGYAPAGFPDRLYVGGESGLALGVKLPQVGVQT